MENNKMGLLRQLSAGTLRILVGAVVLATALTLGISRVIHDCRATSIVHTILASSLAYR